MSDTLDRRLGLVGSVAIGMSAMIGAGLFNASAWTLSASWLSRVIPAIGGVGCLVLALNLTMPTIGAGSVVVGIGAFIYLFRTRG